MFNQFTVYFILAMAAIIAAVDIVLYARKGQEGTISHVLYRAAQRWPVVAFLLGVLAGHLFWSNS